jgi:hypothetical protein
MKLSRRKMFGAAIGGAIAGPQAAKAAIRDWGSQTAKMLPPGAGCAEATLGTDQNWTMEQIAKMKRLAAGDIRDEDRNYPTAGPAPPFEELKSVSDAARRFMQDQKHEREWRERTIKSALDALDHYDKTGILRTFF